MPNLSFNCPACAQPIECDSQFAGQQLVCPFCQETITAPAPAPPPTGKPRGRINLNIAPTPAPASHVPAPTVIPPPSRTPKRKRDKKKIVLIVMSVLLVAGLIAGFPYLSALQDKLTAKLDKANEGSGGGELGHTAELYAVLDATDSAKMHDDGPADLSEELETNSAPERASANLPTIQPTYSLDIEASDIPRSKVNGIISAEPFTPNIIHFSRNGRAFVLLFRQGTNSIERELYVVLRPKPGQSIETNTFIVSKALKTGAPQVTKKWKTSPRYSAQKSYSLGYAMKLEFGKLSDGILPGKIYIALPDKEQTVVAGHFEAETEMISAAEREQFQ
jgi:hypothetical protein